MLILPIGHEDNSVRRLPWATFAIMAVCIVVQIILSSQEADFNRSIDSKFKEFVAYAIKHPYLELDRPSFVRVFGEEDTETLIKNLEGLRARQDAETPADIHSEQVRLNEILRELRQLLDDSPTSRYGYIPAKRNLWGLLTHIFVHGDWFHLLGNLLFLYLVGPFIEDVWGRPLYLAFFFCAGVFASFMFGMHYPDSLGSLIGASGAIAGVMGAFLVRYWKTRIHFFYIVFIVPPGTFSAPAYMILPLWFVLEVFSAKSMDIVRIESGGGGGVAYWSHVWGFAFGVAAALAIKKFKVEERFINPRIEAKLSYADNVTLSLETALKLKQERRFEESFTQILELARANPGREDITRVLWGLSVEQGREGEAARPLAAVIEREVRRDQMDAALDDFLPLRRAKTGVKLSPAANLAMARYLLKKNFADEARELVIETLDQLDPNSPSGLVLGIAEVAAILSPALARRAIELCLANPEIPADRKQKIKDYLDRLPGTK